MAGNPRPYTVSAVVNTDTGELVGTPVIRPGHEDYAGFDTVKPLAANEQFRWVHVWASNPDQAAATDALTADLHPGGDRRRPAARALSGQAGLKPYRVTTVVHTRTGRPVGEPVAVQGHHPLADAPSAGPGTHVHTTTVWATDRADAADQVGTALADARPTAQRTGPAPARGDPDNVVPLADAVAQREWERLAGLPAAARAALVADTVWQRTYLPAYQGAYTAAASRIAAAATQAANTNPDAWLTLHHLTAAAGHAISRITPGHPDPPPADHQTVIAAQTAASSGGPQPPWQRIAATAAAGSHTAATLAGALTAATDVLTGWRGRSGHLTAEGVTVDGTPAHTWVTQLLAAVNRHAAGQVAVAPARTAAQVAHDDQATGVTSRTVSAARGGTRTPISSSPAAAPRRRTR